MFLLMKNFLTTFSITHAYVFLYVSVFLAYDLITNTKLILAIELIDKVIVVLMGAQIFSSFHVILYVQFFIVFKSHSHKDSPKPPLPWYCFTYCLAIHISKIYLSPCSPSAQANPQQESSHITRLTHSSKASASNIARHLLNQLLQPPLTRRLLKRTLNQKFPSSFPSLDHPSSN